MGVDIVLVGDRPLTTDTLRDLFDRESVRAVLGDASVGGDAVAFPRITRVDTPRLNVDFYGPQEARTTGAAPYTTDLGVAAPMDADGRTWWTQVDVTAGGDDEEALGMLFGILATVAAECQGHVVVDGEVIELDGVAAPMPSLAPTPTPVAVGGRAYVEAFLPYAAANADGWGRVLGTVRSLASEHAELLPQWVDVDGDWREFAPSPVPPSWWPMEQRLAVSEPAATWTLAPAAFPGDPLTQVSLSADVDTGTASDLLAGLTALDCAYGFVHYWTPAEELPRPIGLRRDGPEESPYVLLTHRDLAVALPDLYWAQVIGPEWAAAIGPDRLASTPAHRVEEVRPQHWLVQLTADVGDVVLDWAGFAAARTAARAHLGEDLFWRRGLEAPRVTFQPVA
jgi:hypothetical protein